jgi:uncharacterized protein (TIGR02996 family)
VQELNQAAKAAGQGDAEGAIAALLSAWRETRAAEIARALERVTAAALAGAPEPGAWDELCERHDSIEAARLVERLVEGNAAAAAARVAKLDWLADDPRVSAACMRILSEPPYHATGSKPFWTRFFALLKRSADPRARAALKELPVAIKRLVGGEVMRTWFLKKIDETAAALPAEAKLDGDSVKLARAIALSATPTQAQAQPKSKPRKRSVSEADLYAAVYDDPDDDGARGVLADHLIEKGDPRGEFLAMQLRRKDQKEPGRELTLLKKNQAAWLGEIGPVVGYKNQPVLGPEPASYGMHVYVRWHRGFLAGAKLEFNGANLKKLGPLPAWATLEHATLRPLEGGHEAARGALFAAMRGLRGIAGHMPFLRAAAGVDRLRARLELVGAWLGDAETPDAIALLETLPRLRRLEILYTARFEEVLAASLFSRLEEIRFYDEVRIRREGRDLHVALHHGEPSEYAQRLVRSLPAKDVASFTVLDQEPDDECLELMRSFPRVGDPAEP